MYYVYEVAQDARNQAINIAPEVVGDFDRPTTYAASGNYGEEDVDLVDDSLLNTTPHNRIEQQLLRGDVVGLALMSGAILWSAMGAFG